MIHVEDAQHVGGFRLAMCFSDGTRGVADLSGELRRKAFAPLRDERVFAQAYVADGTVCWPGGLDLAAERLYALAHSLKIPGTLEEAEVNELMMSLRELRSLAGKTQIELSEAMGMAQSELSRVERREDLRLSTLRRYVESLGAKLEVVATLGDKRIVLRT